MRGSTMLFTADESGFSAYHANAWKRTRAEAADAEASSIADAHKRFGPTDAYATPPASDQEKLTRVATSHPFSAVVSAYGDPPEGQPHPKYGPPIDAGLGANGKPWSMMNFNYVSSDRSHREVATAEAIIRKDQNGKVTVQVLVGRGKLENKRSSGSSSSTVAPSYREIESATGSYTVSRTQR